MSAEAPSFNLDPALQTQKAQPLPGVEVHTAFDDADPGLASGDNIPPSEEVIDHEVGVATENLDQEHFEMLDNETPKQSRFRRAGRAIVGLVSSRDGSKSGLVSGEEAEDAGQSEARGLQKAKKIAKGEGAGIALEAGLRAAGIGLPVRELVGTALDVGTYSPEGAEKDLRKIAKRSLGILALNLATGYAIQKGMPGFIDFVSHNIQDTPFETGFELTGKVAAMLGGTALLEKKIG